MPYYISPPPQGPVARAIAAIIAGLALAGMFMLSLVTVLVVAGGGLIIGLVIWLRLAWIKRRMRGTFANVEEEHHPGQVIEAEYTVISERDD